MKLEDCKHFDTELFIKQMRIWRREKEALLEELDNMTLLPAAGNESGVRGSDISDPTSRLAIQRIKITDRLKEIERCESVYERAKASLTPDELVIFQMFFEPKKPIWKAIDEYAMGNYTCRGNIYKARRQVVEKLNNIIGKWV